MGSQQTKRQEQTFEFALRERTHAGFKDGFECQGIREGLPFIPAAGMERIEERKHPSDGLAGPRADSVWQIEQRLLAMCGSKDAAAERNVAGVRGDQSRQALEERGLAGTVGTNQAQDFVLLN